MPRPLLLLAALVVAAAPALAQTYAGSSDQGQGTRSLEAGNVLHPAPVSLSKGDALVVDWKVTDPVGAKMFFSFHEHVGQQQVNLSDFNQTQLAQRFAAPRDGLYSILWQNNGDGVTSFQYAYHAERAGATAPAKTPFPAALGLAGLASAALVLRRRRA